LATGVPVILSRCDVYEVATSCGYMLTMLALVAIWCALHEPERRAWWLATASVAYGLLVGARPNFLFGAIMLLVPVGQAWRERRQVWPMLAAATVPITLIGLGLMLYNYLRFDNPFEFGQRYQLGGERQVELQFFSLRYLWFNFRVYFLQPSRWGVHFPFVHEITVPPSPTGYFGVQNTFGVPTNIPVTWLALAVPLAWRSRPSQPDSALRRFAMAVTLLFGTCALTLGLYCTANGRYEADFLPALLLLAVIGTLGLERALADRPIWRRTMRWCWGLLLGFSVAFNLLASVEQCAEAHYNLGNVLLPQGKLPEAVREYECALRLKPDYADAHVNLGTALAKLGRSEDAFRHYEEALRIKPDNPVAHLNIGYALYVAGRVPEAIQEFEAALRIDPDYAEAYNGLGAALVRTGDMPNAITHYEQALRINADYAEAHYNLGIALAQAGRLAEAMKHWEQTLRLKPDDVDARYNLATALQRQGRVPDAIEQFEETLKLRPDYTPAKDALTRLGVVR
jgi:tetratricopeptide (TPR) repeat protein